MYRLCLAALTFIVACSTSAAMAADNTTSYHVGETTRVFHPGVERNWRGAKTQALVTRIWYPVDRSVPEVAQDIGAPGDPLFRGHPFVEDARLSPAHSKYPLILLSHGTGGSAASLDWLAAALAANGYVVAGVNHPGNNELEPLTQEGFVLWWERATDVSEVLDGILGDPTIAAHVDADRIGALGFSLGGYTVLELAGARTRLPAFIAFCHSEAADAICHPPEMKRLKGGAPTPDSLPPEAKASMTRSGDSYRDARIKAVFAIAPALGEAFDSTSFATVDIPVSLLAGAADVTAPVDTNIRRINALLPAADVTLIPGATHYTFLDTCLPSAVERLPVVCKDNPGIDRDAVHAQTIEQVKGFFHKSLPAKTL